MIINLIIFNIKMDCISLLPNIRCSSCGAIIGNKFIQFITLIECGSTRLEAFELLDINQYCCRKDFINPIVLSNKTERQDNKKVFQKEETNLTGQQYSIDIEGRVNLLTNSFGEEIAVVPLSYGNNTDDNYLKVLKIELSFLSSNSGEDIPFKIKEINPEEVIDILSPLNRSKEDVGSGYVVEKINRAYQAV